MQHNYWAQNKNTKIKQLKVLKCRARSKSRWITWRLKEKGMAGDASWEKGLHCRAAAAQNSVDATGNCQPSVKKIWSELNDLVRVIICFLTAHFFDTHFGFKGLILTRRALQNVKWLLLAVIHGAKNGRVMKCQLNLFHKKKRKKKKKVATMLTAVSIKVFFFLKAFPANFFSSV